jgi:tetratricopeptide (TPR) repeat protein
LSEKRLGARTFCHKGAKLCSASALAYHPFIDRLPIDAIRRWRRAILACALLFCAIPDALAKPAPPAPPPRPPSDEQQLAAAWSKWRAALSEWNAKGASEAQAEFSALQKKAGLAELDDFSLGFSRAAEARAKADDAATAVALAQAAVQLSPELPYARWVMAYSLLKAEPSAVSRWGPQLLEAAKLTVKEPSRYRAALAQLGAAFIFAWILCAAAVAIVLFLRCARCLAHDGKHLLPIPITWPLAIFPLLALLLPLAMHWGFIWGFVALGCAAAPYLERRERWALAVLLAGLGGIPMLGGAIAERTAFAGTMAEDVLSLSRPGLSSKQVAARVEERAKEAQASFVELFALGRFELNAGRLDAAIGHMKQALAMSPGHARLLTNLGNAALRKGDIPYAIELYREATSKDPSLAAPLFNVSQAHAQRAKGLSREQVGAELDRAQAALAAAQRLHPDLLLEAPGQEALLSVELSSAELLQAAVRPELFGQVRTQLAEALLGSSSTLAALSPLLGAGWVLILGSILGAGRLSRPCARCGGPSCRRCNPEASGTCPACTAAFAARAPSARARIQKRLLIQKGMEKRSRFSYVLGLLMSGGGHLFVGSAIRGAAYVFCFMFLGFQLWVCPLAFPLPYGSAPAWLWLVPLGVVWVTIHLISLRGLGRQKGAALWH